MIPSKSNKGAVTEGDFQICLKDSAWGKGGLVMVRNRERRIYENRNATIIILSEKRGEEKQLKDSATNNLLSLLQKNLCVCTAC